MIPFVTWQWEVEWYLSVTILLWATAFIFAGYRGFDEVIEGVSADTNVAVVFFVPLFWPVILGIAGLIVPFYCLWWLGRWVRRKIEFWPKVIRRLGGDRS